MKYAIDVMMTCLSNERTKYHLTLGELIEALENVYPESFVKFSDGGSPGSANSYRGYYSDLAFERCAISLASDVLDEARNALGATFEGYKGGDFVMTKDTPL